MNDEAGFEEHFRFRYEIRVSDMIDDGRECVVDICGTAFIDREDSEVEVGTLSAMWIQVGRLMDEKDQPGLFDQMDAHSSLAQEVYMTFFEPGTMDFKEEVNAACDQPMSSDLLIIDNVNVLPAYRGRNIGLVLTRRCIDLFSHACGLVVIKPWPLQFEGSTDRRQRAANPRMHYDVFTGNRAQSMQKLRTHWSKIGFRRLGETDYFVICPERRMRGNFRKLVTASTKGS